jgi:uncharacterized membrane protein
MRQAGINMIIIGLIFIYQIDVVNDFIQSINLTNFFNSSQGLDGNFESNLKNLQTNLKMSGIIQLILLFLSGISLIVDQRNYIKK